MTGRLDLKNIVLRVKLGSQSREKLSSRDVPVSLVWTGEVAENLSVDYSDVCRILAGFTDREYDYIEELAADILKLLRIEYPVGSWKVTVTKPFPPTCLRIESASFTIDGDENA